MKTEEFGLLDNSLTALLTRGKDEFCHINSKKTKHLEQFYAEVPESIRQHEDKKEFSYREGEAVISEFEVPVPVENNTRIVRLRLYAHFSTMYSEEMLRNFSWSYGFMVFGSMHWTQCHSLEHALYSGAVVDMSTPVVKLFGG